MSRVDNGEVGLGGPPATLHVSLAWSVAALTADRMSLKDRRLVAIQRPGYRVELIGVTEKASGLDSRSKFGCVVNSP